MTTASEQLDELCYLSSQSLPTLNISDHFKVIKLLGAGTYGKVMLAVHKTRGTPMALKFFLRHSTPLLSFLREYNLSLSYCTHPSLTRALGIFFSTPCYYVFAQQAGLYGDLYNVIVSETGIAEECVQRVMSQLSGAVCHLHSLGFVHRDIKPENIFLCDSACRWVKLGDFGLSRARGTLVRAVWYDSPFCVPEVEGAKHRGRVPEAEDLMISVEPSIDSWALGVLVYCLMTGCFPWQESTSDDGAYRDFKEWFNGQSERGEEGENKGGQGEGNTCLLTVKEQVKGRVDDGMYPISPQFAAFSPLCLALFRELLNPQPELREGPDVILGYLGGPWLLETESKEKRKMKESGDKARKIREGGVVEKEREREGRGER